LGARSTWFEKTPDHIGAKKKVAIIIRTTTVVTSSSAKQTPIKQPAGTRDAEKQTIKKYNMFFVKCLELLYQMPLISF
jgi:hypothetical protein